MKNTPLKLSRSTFSIKPKSKFAIDDKKKLQNTFIEGVRFEIENKLEDEDFGILELCKAIGLSRSQLHNRIKSATGLSTSIYIRSVKLNRAKYLLENSELNVSQVAYEVGYKDPSYFSRLFTEYFGNNPRNISKGLPSLEEKSSCKIISLW